jgi:4-hydroxy-tetrahydrodipicolinate synthase
MTKNGVDTVLEAVRKVQATAPEVLQPVAEFFNVDIAERLENPTQLEELYYPEY